MIRTGVQRQGQTVSKVKLILSKNMKKMGPGKNRLVRISLLELEEEKVVVD